MSDLDDLEAIAEANAFGFGGLARAGAPRQGHRPPSEVCGAGHPWTPESTRMYRDRGRWRRICRICDKNRATLRRVCDRIADRNAPASEGT